MSIRSVAEPACQATIILQQRTEILFMMLGMFGLMGTAIALGLMLADRLGRRWLGAVRA